MHGQLWMSLFRVRQDVDDLRPQGVYAVALVNYESPSPLTYSEVLVARPVDKAVTITDIWVDSPASVAGGRELWAIPKGLCDFTHEARRRGPLASTAWSAELDGTPILSARFHDVSHAMVRTPFSGRVRQPGLTEGIGAGRGGQEARLTGSAKALPCRSSWQISPDGPLGWLAGHRPLASFRMADFTMSFGG
jgi:acetoacetate decarboxylase